jgi:hypothetical protein
VNVEMGRDELMRRAEAVVELLTLPLDVQRYQESEQPADELSRERICFISSLRLACAERKMNRELLAHKGRSSRRKRGI